MNPGGGGCSEPRSHHCTPAWVTVRDPVSKKKKSILKKKKKLNITKLKWLSWGGGWIHNLPILNGFFVVVKRWDLAMLPRMPQTPGLEQSSHLSLPKCRDYSYEPPCLAILNNSVLFYTTPRIWMDEMTKQIFPQQNV